MAIHQPRSKISRRSPAIKEEIDSIEEDGEEDCEEDRQIEEGVEDQESLEIGTRLQVRAEAGRKAKESTVRIHLECGKYGYVLVTDSRKGQDNPIRRHSKTFKSTQTPYLSLK